MINIGTKNSSPGKKEIAITTALFLLTASTVFIFQPSESVIPKPDFGFKYDKTTETFCEESGKCWKALFSGYSPSFFKNNISTSKNWAKYYKVVYLAVNELIKDSVIKCHLYGI